MNLSATSFRSLLLVALASFALGVAADRLVFFSNGPVGEDPDREAHGASSRSQGLGASARSHRDRPSRSPREAREDHDEEPDEEAEIPIAVRQVMESLERGARVDATTVRDLLARIPAGRHRHGVIERLAWHWGRQDPEAAAAWAEQLRGRDQWVALEGLLHGWAETDPAGAAEFAAALPNSEHSLHMVRSIAHTWAEQDRAAALQWAGNQPDLATRQRALGGVVEVWAGTDPAAAAAFVSSIDNPYERREVLGVTARHWANQNISEAIEWARGLSGEDRQHATNAILHEVAEHDPRRSASLFQDITSGQPPQNPQEAHAYQEMAREVASMWAHSDPSAAAAWALELPETGGMQRGAVAEATERWLRMDGMAAGEWILQLPEGGTRDAAAERVVHSVKNNDPEAAFDWATSISEQDRQTGLMHHVLERWRGTDPAAARSAYETANLSPEQRRHLGELFGGVKPAPDAPAPEPPDPPAGDAKPPAP